MRVIIISWHKCGASSSNYNTNIVSLRHQSKYAKRTSHITVIVESRPPRDQRAAQSARSRRAQGSKAAAGTGPAPAKAPTKKAPAKKAPAKKASATRAGATKTAEASDEAKGGSQ